MAKQVFVTYFQFMDAEPTDVQLLGKKLKEFSDKLEKEEGIKLHFLIGNQYIEPRSIDWLLDELEKLKNVEKYSK